MSGRLPDNFHHAFDAGSVAERYDDYDNATPVGHIASRDIEIIVRYIHSFATVVQALVDVGISEINSVESDVSDYGALRKQELAKALQDARERGRV